jgi:spermidine synthase
MKLDFRYLKSFVREEMMEKSSSPYNEVLEVEYSYGRLMLNSRHVNYSYGTLDKIMRTAFSQLKVERSDVYDILILGLGVGNIVNILAEHPRNYRVVGVEIDAEVIRLGNKYFGLDQIKDLEIVVADALEFVPACKEKFDLVIVDLFQDAYVPAGADTDRFLLGLARLMRPNGLLMWNRLMLDDELGQQTEDFTRKMANVLPGTRHMGAHGNRILYYEKK